MSFILKTTEILILSHIYLQSIYLGRRWCSAKNYLLFPFGLDLHLTEEARPFVREFKGNFMKNCPCDHAEFQDMDKMCRSAKSLILETRNSARE